jgi:hypothetical protein
MFMSTQVNTVEQIHCFENDILLDVSANLLQLVKKKPLKIQFIE